MQLRPTTVIQESDFKQEQSHKKSALKECGYKRWTLALAVRRRKQTTEETAVTTSRSKTLATLRGRSLIFEGKNKILEHPELPPDVTFIKTISAVI